MDARDGDALSRLGAVRSATIQDTSLAAQAAIQHARSELQRTVYEYIFTCGSEGATDEEIQLGISMNGSTERPRRRELEKAGVVIDSGTTRRTLSGRRAIVWKIRQIASDAANIPRADRLRQRDPWGL